MKDLTSVGFADLDNYIASSGWVGVDLDGTLARCDGWVEGNGIGDPIPEMVEKIKCLLAKGVNVKIFTARYHNGEKQIEAIYIWLEKAGLPRLEVTATKDFQTIAMWDDRCIRVVKNTGEFANEA